MIKCIKGKSLWIKGVLLKMLGMRGLTNFETAGAEFAETT